MKNLKKHLLLITISLGIIVLSSIFSEKMLAQSTDCSLYNSSSYYCNKQDDCIWRSLGRGAGRCDSISASAASPTPTPTPIQASAATDCTDSGGICRGLCFPNETFTSAQECGSVFAPNCCIPKPATPTPIPPSPTPTPASRLVWRLLASCPAPTPTSAPTNTPTPIRTPRSTDCQDSGGICRENRDHECPVGETPKKSTNQCGFAFSSFICCIPNPPPPTSAPTPTPTVIPAQRPTQSPSCTISIFPTAGFSNLTRFNVEGTLSGFPSNQTLSRIDIINEAQNTVIGGISPSRSGEDTFSVEESIPFTKPGNYHLNVVVSRIRGGETVLCRSGTISVVLQRSTPTPTRTPSPSQITIVPTSSPTPIPTKAAPSPTPTSSLTKTPPTPTPTQPAVAVTTPSVSCPLKPRGDANCDGKINIVDFNIWRDEFKKTLATLTADFDGKDGVNIVDFNIWRDGFKDPSLPH